MRGAPARARRRSRRAARVSRPCLVRRERAADPRAARRWPGPHRARRAARARADHHLAGHRREALLSPADELTKRLARVTAAAAEYRDAAVELSEFLAAK